jgi:hypothetical protein
MALFGIGGNLLGNVVNPVRDAFDASASGFGKAIGSAMRLDAGGVYQGLTEGSNGLRQLSFATHPYGLVANAAGLGNFTRDAFSGPYGLPGGSGNLDPLSLIFGRSGINGGGSGPQGGLPRGPWSSPALNVSTGANYSQQNPQAGLNTRAIIRSVLGISS